MTKKSKIITGVIVALLILAVAGLAVALGLTEKNRKSTQSRLNAVYEKSYYETMDNMSDIELKLSKISVLSGNSLKKQLLNDVWRECDVVASDFSQLGAESEELNKVIKFLNQLGDYCYYLALKLQSGGLSDKENQNLKDYYGIIKKLNIELSKAQDTLTNGEKIDASVLSDRSLIENAIKSHSSVEYPEMIYDGPFSDGLNDRETKFLSGKNEITPENGLELIATYFPDATDVQAIGEGSSSIPTYLYQFNLGRNQGTAQLSKIGGYLTMYNAYCEIDDPTLSEEECIQKAKEYLARFGYENLKDVWVCNNNSTVYINFAHCENDVIVYPDLIKVKICSQTGDLIGLEAQNYLYNHTDRQLTPPSDASVSISSGLKIISQALCLIPTEWNTEILAKEVVAEMDEITYYMYFDVNTGEELKVMVVIDEDGKMLI